MHLNDDQIELKEALKDFLKESKITLSDVLAAMDEEKQSLLQALSERVWLSQEDSRILEKSLSSRELNLLLFALQVFYVTNLSGLDKGREVYPPRDEVMRGTKATLDGVRKVGRALGIRVDL